MATKGKTIVVKKLIFENASEQSVAAGGGGSSSFFDDDGTTASPLPSAAGSKSIAIGQGSITNGADSLAIGTSSSVALAGGIAIGKFTRSASGTYAVAIGGGTSAPDSATAGGDSSIALGRGSDATSAYSIAIGRNAQATTSFSAIAIGGSSIPSYAASAIGGRAIAIGYGTDATGGSAIAIGANAQATSSDAIAIRGTVSSVGGITVGGQVQPSATYAVSIGRSSNAISGASSAVVIGHAASTGQAQSVVIGYGSSTSGGSGNSNVLIGRSVTSGTSGSRCVVIGRSAASVSTYGVIIGDAAQTRHIGTTGTVCIGQSAIVGHTSFDATASIAIGQSAKAFSATASIQNAIAIGTVAVSENIESIAIGVFALASIRNTIQLQATSIIRKDTVSVSHTSTEAFKWCAGNEAIVFTKEVVLDSGTPSVELTVPANSTFYPTEVGVIFTSGTLSAPPSVSFGINGTTNKFVTATATTLATVKDREVFTPLTTAGENTLVASVTAAGTGTSAKGRFYFKGILLENQP